jgi:hypothetical protein
MSDLFKEVLAEMKKATLTEAPVEVEPETPSTPEGEEAVVNSDGEIIHQGDFYVLKTTPDGAYIIVRLADGAYAEFAIDDTPEIDTDLKSFMDYEEPDFIDAFDRWAQNFDIILAVPDLTEATITGVSTLRGLLNAAHQTYDRDMESWLEDQDDVKQYKVHEPTYLVSPDRIVFQVEIWCDNVEIFTSFLDFVRNGLDAYRTYILEDDMNYMKVRCTFG